MTVLNERDRTGSRFNAVDAAVAVVLLMLIPLAIGAYLLFRTPPPSLSHIAPSTIVEGPNQRIEIDGANLRPFMRVTLDTIPANAFLLGSTKYGLVDLPPLKPGAYDVVLYDYAREVARLPKALTVAPVATDVELDVDGAFKSPSDAAAGQLKVGATFAPGGMVTILALGAAAPGEMRLRVGDDVITVPQGRSDLPATLRVKCLTIKSPDGAARCAVPIGDERTVIAPAALLTLQSAQGPVVFQISGARAPKR